MPELFQHNQLSDPENAGVNLVITHGLYRHFDPNTNLDIANLAAAQLPNVAVSELHRFDAALAQTAGGLERCQSTLAQIIKARSHQVGMVLGVSFGGTIGLRMQQQFEPGQAPHLIALAMPSRLAQYTTSQPHHPDNFGQVQLSSGETLPLHNRIIEHITNFEANIKTGGTQEPITWIYGEHDPLVDATEVGAIKTNSPHLSAHEIPGMGHSNYHDFPSEIAQHISGAIERAMQASH